MSVLSVEERSVGERVLTGATFFLVVQRKTGKQTKGSRDLFFLLRLCAVRLCAAFVCCAFVCCAFVCCVCVLCVCVLRLCAVRLCAACSEILMDE